MSEIPFDMGDHYLYLTKHQVDILRKTFIREFLVKKRRKYYLNRLCYNVIRKEINYWMKELEGED